MTLATRAVRSTLFVLASSYTNMGMGFVTTIVLTRLLAPDQFGIFALATFFYSLLDARSKLGLDYAFIHKQPTTEELLATHWLTQLALSTTTLLAVLVLLPILPFLGYSSEIGPVLIALGIIGILEGSGTTARAALEKELTFARSTLVITGALALSYIVAIVLAWRGMGYWSLAAQMGSNALVSTIGFWWAYRRTAGPPLRWRCFCRPLAAWMIRYGAILIPAALAMTLLLQFDNFLIGTLVNATILGFYERAYKIAQWPTGLVTHIVSRTALPTYAKLQDDPARLAKAFTLSLWLITMTALPIALAIFVSAPDFVHLLFGENWLPSATFLRFLIAYSVLRPLLDDTGALFTAIGKPQRISIVLIVQALTLVITAIPLTLWYGAVGTTISVGIAFAVGIVLTYTFVSHTLATPVYPAFVPPAVAIVASLILYWLLIQFLDLNSLPLFWRVIAKGGIVVAAYLAAILVIEPNTFWQRLRYLWQLLRSG